jgi:hypothetical protein
MLRKRQGDPKVMRLLLRDAIAALQVCAAELESNPTRAMFHFGFARAKVGLFQDAVCMGYDSEQLLLR